MKSSARVVVEGISKKNVEWDEAVIAEHDAERGTRMTIDEPKTPFAYLDAASYDEQSKDAAELEQKPSQFSNQWADLESKLNKVAHQQEKHGDVSQLQEPQTLSVETQKKSSDAFRRKMKAHYNEIEGLKRFRAMQGNLDASDDEDEDEDR